MKKILCLCFFLSNFFAEAQNLVPNGDFESYVLCPTGHSLIAWATPWMNPSTNTPFTGSPDYFNKCAIDPNFSVPWNACGFQDAHSGFAYAGIYLWQSGLANCREYIEVPLTSTLLEKDCYHFEMYVNLGDICKFTTDAIGVWFCNIAITGVPNYYPLPASPQIINTAGNNLDAWNWTLVSGNYVASGGESYLIIGNFSHDLLTNVAVVDSLNPFNAAYCYIDDVSLTRCETGINDFNENDGVNIFPNPATEQLIIDNGKLKIESIEIYNLLGEKVLQPQTSDLKPQTTIDVSELTPGIYFVTVTEEKGKRVVRKVVKM